MPSDSTVRVRLAEVALHPRLHVAVRGVRRDDPESLVVELRDREVRLELPALVEPLRVRDLTALAVDVVGRDEIENGASVAAFDEELRHERHVHEDDALTAGLVLRFPIREPALAAP